MATRLKKLIQNPYFVAGLLLLLAIFASLQDYLTGFDSPANYTKYNNFMIFLRSFGHLAEGQNLYIAYPDEFWDLFKYSPAFALFFGLFNLFPVWLGLNLWNLLNASVLAFGVFALFKEKPKHINLAIWIVLIDALTSFQTHQSNGLIAGMILLSMAFAEKQNLFVSTGLIVATAFIKIFGIAALLIFLFYPEKWKSAVYTLMWIIVFTFIPLLITDWDGLMLQYNGWWEMLKSDHSASFGFSVMGWLHSWFGLEKGKLAVLAIGTLGLLLPLLKWKLFSELKFRMLFLASLLIWLVIFNHKAESPTFVIAMAGTAIWFLNSSRNIGDIILISFAIVFTSLSPSDLFPASIRLNFFVPYVIKVVPMIVIWLKINYELINFSVTDSRQMVTK